MEDMPGTTIEDLEGPGSSLPDQYSGTNLPAGGVQAPPQAPQIFPEPVVAATPPSITLDDKAKEMIEHQVRMNAPEHLGRPDRVTVHYQVSLTEERGSRTAGIGTWTIATGQQALVLGTDPLRRRATITNSGQNPVSLTVRAAGTYGDPSSFILLAGTGMDWYGREQVWAVAGSAGSTTVSVVAWRNDDQGGKAIPEGAQF